MSTQYLDEENEENALSIVDATEPPPQPWYTIALLIGIGCAFAAQLMAGLDEPRAGAAAFDKPVFLAGSYWLILTGATVHASFLHVFMNSYAFYSFGRIAEQLSNRAHLAITFLLSCIGGGILSLVVNPSGTSVGASGGIVGVIGYLAVYAFRRRQFISPEFRKSLLINIGFIAIFGLVLFQTIDNFGHLGGFVAGGLYGLIQIPSDPNVNPSEASQLTETLGLIALGVYLAACAFGILLTLGVI